MVRQRVPRRQKLIEIGLDLFSHHVYEEVSIDDIAEIADISKGLLYYYFPTKHDFYLVTLHPLQRNSSRSTAGSVLSKQVSPMPSMRFT